ncbi:MAG TPA: 30S ribosome-binding factor RbfA [Gemmatimonadaceae bacterium]|nr:30S ribosome-binding factor RbfA [Gemmatimonadaceae bacterium]
MNSRRPDRVSEAIREAVAMFLTEGVKDPRVKGLVTVTGVDVTRDLRHARVHVSIMGTDAEKKETMEGLQSVAGHLRAKLGRTLRLRVTPELDFRYDASIAHAARIDSLLEQIRTDDKPSHGDREP